MRFNRPRAALVAGLTLVGAVTACVDDSSTTGPTTTSDPTATTGSTTNPTTSPATSPATEPGESDGTTVRERSELSQEDIDGLLWMREEEQLAHDVYAVLGDEWGLRIFDNIAAAESRHVDRVVGLLDDFGIDDPMDGQPAGTFTIPQVQELYDNLVDEGRNSVVDALAVGALIEETDITDLRARVSSVAQIQTAYDALERGSRNHLRAFVSQLETRDVDYEPVVLAVADYNDIVSVT